MSSKSKITSFVATCAVAICCLAVADEQQSVPSAVDHVNEAEIQNALQRLQAHGSKEEIQNYLAEARKANEKTIQAPEIASRGKAASVYIMAYLAIRGPKGEFAGFSNEYIAANVGGPVEPHKLEQIGLPLIEYEKMAADRVSDQYTERCSYLTDPKLSDKDAVRKGLIKEINSVDERAAIFEVAIDELIATLHGHAGQRLRSQFDEFSSKIYSSQKTIETEPYYLSIAHILRPALELGCLGADEPTVAKAE